MESSIAAQYNITVNGQRPAGEVDNVYGLVGNNVAITAVSVIHQYDGMTMVNFMLKNNDVWVLGGFEYPSIRTSIRLI